MQGHDGVPAWIEARNVTEPVINDDKLFALTVAPPGYHNEHEIATHFESKLQACASQAPPDHGLLIYISDRMNGLDHIAKDNEELPPVKRQAVKKFFNGWNQLPFNQRLQVLTTTVGALTVPLYLISAGISFNEWQITKTKDEAIKRAKLAKEQNEKKLAKAQESKSGAKEHDDKKVASERDDKKKRHTRGFPLLPPPPPFIAAFRKRSLGDNAKKVVAMFRRGSTIAQHEVKAPKKENVTLSRAMALVGASTTLLYLPSGYLGLRRAMAVRDGDTSAYKRSLVDDGDSMEGFTFTCVPVPVQKKGEERYEVQSDALNNLPEQDFAASQAFDLAGSIATSSRVLTKRSIIPPSPDHEDVTGVAFIRRDEPPAGNGGGGGGGNGGGGNGGKGYNRGNGANGGRNHRIPRGENESKREYNRRVRAGYQDAYKEAHEPVIFHSIDHQYHLDPKAPRIPDGPPGGPLDLMGKSGKKAQKGQMKKMALVAGGMAIASGLFHHFMTAGSSPAPNQQAAAQQQQMMQQQQRAQEEAAYMDAQRRQDEMDDEDRRRQQQLQLQQLQQLQLQRQLQAAAAQQQQQHHQAQQYAQQYGAGLSAAAPAAKKRHFVELEGALVKRQELFSPDSPTEDHEQALYKRHSTPKKIIEIKHTVNHYNVNPESLHHYGIPEGTPVRNEHFVSSNGKYKGNGEPGSGDPSLPSDPQVGQRLNEAGDGSISSSSSPPPSSSSSSSGKMSKTKLGLAIVGGAGFGLYASGLYNQHTQPASAAPGPPAMMGGYGDDQYGDGGYMKKRDLPSVGGGILTRAKREAAYDDDAAVAPSADSPKYGDYLAALRERLDTGLDEGEESKEGERGGPVATGHDTKVKARLQKRGQLEYSDDHNSTQFLAKYADRGGVNDEESYMADEDASDGKEKARPARRSIVTFNQDKEGNHLHIDSTLLLKKDQLSKEAEAEALQSDKGKKEAAEEKETLPQRREDTSVTYTHDHDGVKFNATTAHGSSSTAGEEGEGDDDDEDDESVVFFRREEHANEIQYDKSGDAVNFNAHYNLEPADAKAGSATGERLEGTASGVEDHADGEVASVERRSETKNTLNYSEDKEGNLNLQAESSIHNPSPAAMKVTMDAQVSPNGTSSFSFTPTALSASETDLSLSRRKLFAPDR
ncbi:hypothetical protein CBS101457_001751 [Exobasidium rhododendri]|nr:hypothetical protein CBS101457_001751 [Exobasidium rhododendri]